MIKTSKKTVRKITDGMKYFPQTLEPYIRVQTDSTTDPLRIRKLDCLASLENSSPKEPM